MAANHRTSRFFIGLAALVIVLAIGFVVTFAWVPTYGATPEEVSAVYPGDELLTQPIVNWTHGATIAAPVEQVWQWIAQLGDRRAGFYSFMFIENMVAGGNIYHNASAILPEHQDPQPGMEIIGGAMKLREIKTGEYILADSVGELYWTWMWQIKPVDANTTRLVIRMMIQPPGEMGSNPIFDGVMNLGGFIMEKNMIQGIKERAEGGGEWAYIEVVEIAIWLVTLGLGIAAAVLYIRRTRGLPFLAVGIGAVILLFVLTFVQPAIWLRVVLMIVVGEGLHAALIASREETVKEKKPVAV